MTILQNKLTFVSLLASLTAIATYANASTYDQTVLNDHPIMYLEMSTPTSGTEKDTSGNGHNGQYYGSTPQATNMPNGDIATKFNGANNYLQVPSASVLSVPKTGVLTLEAWMRPDVLQFPHEEGSGYVYWMGKGMTGEEEYAGRMYSYTNTESPPRPNRISDYAWNLSGGLGSGSYFQDTVTAGNWIHVTMVINMAKKSSTYPTGYVKIYKGATLRGTTALDQFKVVPGTGTAPFRVGTRSMSSFFEGAIGKVAVYNYELTPAQVSAHNNAM